MPDDETGGETGLTPVDSRDEDCHGGDPDTEGGILDLEFGGSGEQMPLIAPPLDAEAMARIETWIMIGAPP